MDLSCSVLLSLITEPQPFSELDAVGVHPGSANAWLYKQLVSFHTFISIFQEVNDLKSISSQLGVRINLIANERLTV